MNKQGQLATYGYVLMLAVVIIILALALAKPVNDQSIESRATMECNSTSDDFVSAGCIVSDLGNSYFILSLIAIGGIVVGARLFFG